MIILLCGPDTFRSQQKLQEIVNQYQKSQKQGLNFRRFDAENVNFQDFSDETRQVSMFKEKKLIILENAFSDEDFKGKFLKEKEKFAESEDVIVFFEKEKIPVNDTLLKFLIKKAKVQQFEFLEGKKMLDWIQAEAAKYGAKFSEKALIKLAGFVGKDLWRMDNEIKKLANYTAAEKRKTIAEEDIALLVKPKIETDIFKTIDAIAEKRKGQAFQLLHRHLAAGDAPLYLLTMVNYQFRNLLVVKDLMEKNNPFQIVLSKSGLHPFVARKSCYLAQKFSFSELKKIYRKIFQIDSDVKTGKIDVATALDLFLAEI